MKKEVNQKNEEIKDIKEDTKEKKNKYEDVDVLDETTEETEYYFDKTSNINFRIPEDFRIEEETGEIYKYTKDGPVRISNNLVLITGIINNLDDDTEKLKLKLKKKNKEKEGIFLKSQVYGSPMELANFGIPINVTNSRSMIKYLADLEAENEDTIPIIKAVSKLGWREGKFIPFSKDSDIVVDIDYKLQKWVNAYTPKGNLEDWIEKIKPFRENKIFRFIMSASFAAPLLNLIGHRIFIVFNWGESRGGKTAGLKAALSVWGNPDDLTLTFNTTAVGIERLAGFYNDLPLGLDEKQVNKSQSDIEKIIYMLASGISRIRGNKTGGVQQMNFWNTIVLSTGEETISSTNTNTGVQTRCLEIEGSPFDRNEKSASKMYHIIKDEYGTAGPFFIDKVIKEYGDNNYHDLKEKHNEIVDKLTVSTSNDILSYISSVAIVTLADILIGKWLFNESEETSIEMAQFILEKLDKSNDIDIVDKCYEYIVSWLKGHHKQFDRVKKSLTKAEKTELELNPENDVVEDSRTTSLGIYNEGTYYVLRNVLEDLLKSRGYSYYKITKEFANRGYIIPKKGEDGQIISVSTEKKFRGSNVRMFEFPIFKTEKMSYDKRIKLRRDYSAQVQGYENYKDQIEKENDMMTFVRDTSQISENEKRDIQELQKAQAEMLEKIED